MKHAITIQMINGITHSYHDVMITQKSDRLTVKWEEDNKICRKTFMLHSVRDFYFEEEEANGIDSTC